jgi:hypothetical protein
MHNVKYIIFEARPAISFGRSLVIAGSLVPSPAAGITAFLNTLEPPSSERALEVYDL